MLDKLKQWTQRVLDWSSTDADAEEGCREAVLHSTLRPCPLDPRELPRPPRPHDINSGESPEEIAADDVLRGNSRCSCKNCTQLSSQLLECAICLEPLTSPARSVTSCLECGNIACHVCAARLPRCPYCRADNGLAPNIALERLLHKLDIPCHKRVLPVRCPHKKCKWRGDIDNLSKHLEQAHLVTILNGSSVTLYIAEFQRKAELSETRPRHYSVLLACFSDVFVCKVSLHHGKLKVVLSQLTQARHLGAWVEISCPSKTMKGIIPLSKSKADVEVPVTNFVTPTRGHEDRVSISISVRPLS